MKQILAFTDGATERRFEGVMCGSPGHKHDYYLPVVSGGTREFERDTYPDRSGLKKVNWVRCATLRILGADHTRLTAVY